MKIPKNKQGTTNITELHLKKSLSENIEMLKALFKNDNTFVIRYIHQNMAVFFFDGMVNNVVIAENVVEPLVKLDTQKMVNAEIISKYIVEANDSKITDNMTDILNAFLYGDSLILVDGDDRGVLVNTKGFVIRGTAEPESEKVLSGSREGFIEAFMINLSFVRRRLRTPDLKFKYVILGSTTSTTAVICYIDGICDEKVLKTFEKRLKTFHIDSVLDSNYVVECIKDSKFSPFPTIGTTERPDVFVAKLLEGRVGLIVDGTPVAITAPHILLEAFQTNEDYYLNFIYANMNRVLRIFGFLFSISVPAIFLAMITYHHELIPTKLLFSISSAREGVPFPAFLEFFTLVVIFEILKEAGNRTPSSIGQTLSIVGALVLGQSAVEARFVSAPIVIIVAFSGITALMIPKLKVASVFFRLLNLIFSAFFGLYGLVFGIALGLIHVCSIESFSVPYISNLANATKENGKDSIMRFPWNLMKPSNRFLSGD